MGNAVTHPRPINTLRKLGSIYQGHPDVPFHPGLEASTGSLGEGLVTWNRHGARSEVGPTASRTYVILGDGKARKGNLESAMFAATRVWTPGLHVDYNHIQLTIRERYHATDPLPASGARSIGNVIDLDGHDIPA